MATVSKDFRTKGLAVDGNATVNASDIITEAAITGGIQSNISVTYNPLTKVVDFVAENGVADSTTDDLAEGVANLYFTDERAQDAFGAMLSGAQSGITVSYDDANNQVTFSVADQFPSHDTDDLAEGSSNLYFTDERAQDALAAGTHTNITISYDDVTNSFSFTGAVTYTDADARAALSAGDGISYDSVNGIISASAATLGGISVGASGIEVNRSIVDTWYDAAGSATAAETNAKSYTDSLIGDPTVNGTAGNTVKDRIDTAVSNLVDGAPALLDTLNELAAAINDDAGFATTITTSIGEKVAKAGDTMTGELILSGDPTNVLGAAPKQYVDQAETDAVATAELYTDTAIGSVLNGSTAFTAVNINSVAQQVAATVSALALDTAIAYSFAKASYRSAKFIVKLESSTHTEVSEVVLTLDASDNIAISEYGIVSTNGTLSEISAAIVSNDVVLTVVPNYNVDITVVGTLIA